VSEGASGGPSPPSGAPALERPLTLALPKGRTLQPVAAVFAAAGVSGVSSTGAPCTLAESLLEETRALVRRGVFLGHPMHFLLLKPDDVPTYVDYGTADLGVCGRDVLLERDVDVYHPVDLGLGRCRMVVAGKASVSASTPTPTPTGHMPRVATKYPKTAAAHFARRGIQVEVVNVQSSVELAPLTGLADLIVDLVETGATLAQNGLEVKETIVDISTVLLANRASFKLRADVMKPLVAALRSATGGA
jgi:ATP phosphoribosyltransferase